jgi:ATP-dependent RNA helicase DDX56/DBP9
MPDAALVDDQLTFASFAHIIDSRILRGLADLGFARPTLVQSRAIPLALEGRDILARARTGSGKTAAYCIPVIQKIISAKSVSFSITFAMQAIVRHAGTRTVGKCTKNARPSIGAYARVSRASCRSHEQIAGIL